MELKAFHAKVVKDPGAAPPAAQLPIVREVDAVMIRDNFQRVKREVEELVGEEMQRILGDPSLKGWIVKGRS